MDYLHDEDSRAENNSEISGIRAALIGIFWAWTVVGVLFGIGWLAYGYPETFIYVALAIVITVVGAMLGLTAKYGDPGDYWL